MCGLTGILSENKISDDLILKIEKKLYHRGPDNFSIAVHNNNYFFHHWLSIIDL